jgi:DNA-binding CsgD family transcriptional regulator
MLSGTEIMTMWFVPDAVEAMVVVGQLDEAYPDREPSATGADWIAHGCSRPERDAGPCGSPAAARSTTRCGRSPRRWSNTIGCRCRSNGPEHNRAGTAPTTAAAEASRRTDFQRGVERIRANGRIALDRSDPRGADRTNVGLSRSSILTLTEERIAQLATSGMTNRDVAATLFISLKTVEANLTQIYRKLKIKSRAQLAQKLRSGSGLG